MPSETRAQCAEWCTEGVGCGVCSPLRPPEARKTLEHAAFLFEIDANTAEAKADLEADLETQDESMISLWRDSAADRRALAVKLRSLAASPAPAETPESDAGTDAERLDWLEAQAESRNVWLESHPLPAGSLAFDEEGPRRWRFVGQGLPNNTKGRTAREAIDAARAALSPRPTREGA